jgi:hypothetical protein
LDVEGLLQLSMGGLACAPLYHASPHVVLAGAQNIVADPVTLRAALSRHGHDVERVCVVPRVPCCVPRDVDAELLPQGERYYLEGAGFLGMHSKPCVFGQYAAEAHAPCLDVGCLWNGHSQLAVLGRQLADQRPVLARPCVGSFLVCRSGNRRYTHMPTARDS